MIYQSIITISNTHILTLPRSLTSKKKLKTKSRVCIPHSYETIDKNKTPSLLIMNALLFLTLSSCEAFSKPRSNSYDDATILVIISWCHNILTSVDNSQESFREEKNISRPDNSVVQTYLLPRSSCAISLSSIIVYEPIPGKIRFLRTSHPNALAPSRHILAFSKRLWPWSPHNLKQTEWKCPV